jgi:argonaute-like protein implicated in RNA metabolism and viral defense
MAVRDLQGFLYFKGGIIMSIFSSREDLKEFHEESITWSEGWVKHYKESVKSSRESVKEWEERVKVTPLEFSRQWLKGQRKSLRIEMRGLKHRKDELAKLQKDYEQYYGQRFSHGKVRPMKRSLKQKLTVIKGGRPDTKIHGGILSDIGKKFFTQLEPEKV